MKRSPDISLIIVNYNGKRFLKHLIESIRRQSLLSHETIIVDNDSSDHSAEYIAKNFPEIKLIRSANIGYGRGCNLGAKSAKGKFLIFLNPDLYLPQDCLLKILKFYRLKSSQYSQPIGCIGIHGIKFGSDPKSFPPAGGGIIDLFGTPRESHNPQYIEDSFFSMGTGLFIKNQVFKKIKGFTPNIFLYGEEIDLCWRLKTQGYRHFIDNNNYFFHLGGGSKFGDNHPRQVALMTYGCFLDSFTNFQTVTLIFILPLYFLYLLSIIIFLPILKNFNYKYSFEIIIAFQKFFRDFKNIIKFRNFVQKYRKVNDLQLARYISLIPSIFLH
jgi:GT2 family glycosyltransferase